MRGVVQDINIACFSYTCVSEGLTATACNFVISMSICVQVMTTLCLFYSVLTSAKVGWLNLNCIAKG